jgi:DNA-binding LytR/AlgR family response regulator
MNLRCIIIDDEPFARKLLIDYCGKIPQLTLLADFSNGLEALSFLNRNDADLIFLDIKMPSISGIDLLKSINNRPKVIFTTAFAEYAIDGFELDAVDYLLKPFDFPRFLKAVNKALVAIPDEKSATIQPPKSQDDFLFVKDGRDLVKLYLNDILYIKGQKDYVMFIGRERKIMSLMNMKDLEADLSRQGFLRIHQSFIVNTKHIQVIANDKIKVNNEYLPVSQTYKLGFKEFLQKHQ